MAIWKFNTLGHFEWEEWRIEKSDSGDLPYRLYRVNGVGYTLHKTFEEASKEAENGVEAR